MKERGILLAMALLCLVSVAGGVLFFFSFLVGESEADAQRHAEQTAETLARQIALYDGQQKKAAGLLGLEPELRSALAALSERTLAEADAELDRCRLALTAEVCYLMDARGNTLASSNRNEPQSFVGKNYAFRPYFRQAMTGKASVYLALGVTSRKRGLYFASPVVGDAGPIGVVVVKTGVESLERELGEVRHPVALIDENGVVFVSNRPSWLYRTLGKLSAAKALEIGKSRQFGEEAPGSVGIEITAEGQALGPDGSQYRLGRRDVEGLAGWQVIYLHDTSNSAIDAMSRQRWTAVVVLVLFICISIGILLLYRAGGRDIARRLVVEAELRRLQRAIEQSPVTVVITDREGTIQYVNPAFTRITGFASEEVIGENPRVLKSGEHGREFYEDMWKTIASGEVWQGTICNRKKDASLYWEQAWIAPVSDAEGGISNFVAVKQDITERRRYQEALEEKTRELARSNAELEQYGYVISHDLQEPLRTITGFLGLIERGYGERLDGQGTEYLSFALTGAKRMSQMIHDLLDHSRIVTKGKRPVATESGACLAEALANLEAAAQEAGAVITQGTLPEVTADPSQLTRLFQNLVGNALKYRDPVRPLRIDIAAERLADKWVFSIRDNGIGIEPRQFERVFKVFQRLHSASEYPGTGIGLANCRKIVERHGGRIWIESTPGTGSTFFFSLPVKGE